MFTLAIGIVIGWSLNEYYNDRTSVVSEVVKSIVRKFTNKSDRY